MSRPRIRSLNARPKTPLLYLTQHGNPSYSVTLNRNRTDTIKCIVSALVNPADDSSEHLELDEDGDIKALEDRDDREEDYTDPNWVPEPIDAAPGALMRHLSCLDLLSVLLCFDVGSLERLFL